MSPVMCTFLLEKLRLAPSPPFEPGVRFNAPKASSISDEALIVRLLLGEMVAPPVVPKLRVELNVKSAADRLAATEMSPEFEMVKELPITVPSERVEAALLIEIFPDVVFAVMVSAEVCTLTPVDALSCRVGLTMKVDPEIAPLVVVRRILFPA